MKWTNKGHELDAVSNILENIENCYIWGVGAKGIELSETLLYLHRFGINWTVKFVDSDIKKQNTSNYGSDIFSPEALNTADKQKSIVVVCASDANTPAIIQVAVEKGYRQGENLFDFAYFHSTLLPTHMLYQYDKVFFPSINIVVSTVCNLNCNSCLNFNPFIKRHTTYSPEELKKGADAFFSVVDYTGRFQITGGEPMLYKHLNELIEYIGSKYREQIQNFETVTNGTIIPSEDTVQLLKKYDMRVYLDDYGMSIKEPLYKFREIYYLLKAHRIDVIHNFVPQWFDLTPDLFEESVSDEAGLIAHYTNCGCPWATLIGTSISSCNYSMYSYKAGIVDYFAEEYLDLTQITNENKAELVEWRCRYNEKGYVELCKRCAGFNGNTNLITPAMQIPKNGG